MQPQSLALPPTEGCDGSSTVATPSLVGYLWVSGSSSRLQGRCQVGWRNLTRDQARGMMSLLQPSQPRGQSQMHPGATVLIVQGGGDPKAQGGRVTAPPSWWTHPVFSNGWDEPTGPRHPTPQVGGRGTQLSPAQCLGHQPPVTGLCHLSL